MAIIPTPPPNTATTGAVPSGAPPQVQSLGEVVVEQVPERIAQLARSILLSGTIVEQQQGGAVVVRTQVGELIIRSPTPLPLDKVITLQIPPGAPPVRAQVTIATAISATAPSPAPTSASAAPPISSPVASPLLPPISSPLISSPLSTPAAAAVASSLPSAARISAPSLIAATQAVTSLPLLAGAVLPAQVLALPDPTKAGQAARGPLGAALPAALSTFSELQKAGTPALQALFSAGLSDILSKLPAAIVSPPGWGAPSPLPAPASLAPVPAFANLPVLLTLPPGSQVTVQVERITPPPTSSAMPAAQPSLASSLAPASVLGVPLPARDAAPTSVGSKLPPVFSALVIGQTPQGEPLATSPAGLLVLANRAPLAPGSLIELSVVHVQEAAAERSADLPARMRDWPVLQQILQAQPTLTASTKLTRPDNIGGIAAFLAVALKLGAPQRVLTDEAIETLRRSGQAELVTRLVSEAQQSGQTFNRTEAPATDWRSLLLPLPPESAMTRLALHIRREADAENEAAGPLAVKRLVVEVELSRLGPLLLDGYIRPKWFDLTLRSQRRLPRRLQGELRLAYRDALSALSWQGGLEFQTAAELWLGRAV
jgi:hypothetical protein